MHAMVVDYAPIFRPARLGPAIVVERTTVELFKDSTGSSRQLPHHTMKAAQPNSCAAFVYRTIPVITFTARIN